MDNDFLSRVLKSADMYFTSKDEHEKLKSGLKKEVSAALSVKQGEAGDTNVLAKGGIVRETVLLCKKAGVYPYYVCKLAAAAFFYKASEDRDISNTISLLGIRGAIEKIMEFYLEPELSYLISEAYACILDNTLFETDEKRLALVAQGYERGFKNEALHRGCAQCTLMSFFETAKKTGEKEEYLFRAASSLAGGIAGCCDSACGAYSASNLIMSSYVGRELSDIGASDGGTTIKSNELGRIMHDKYEDVYGSNVCGEIHEKKFGEKFDLRIPEEKKAFDEAGAHDDKCTATVGLATAWLIEILYDNNLI